jgi:peptide chain release factor 1
MQLLLSKLWKHYEDERQAKLDSTRQAAVGTGERSEKIRTYNYPQNRITDHRIGLSLNKLDYIMSTGHLEEIIQALITNEQEEKLANLKI